MGHRPHLKKAITVLALLAFAGPASSALAEPFHGSAETIGAQLRQRI